MKFFYLSIFRNSVEPVKVSLNSDKLAGTLHEDLRTFMIISRSILFRINNADN